MEGETSRDINEQTCPLETDIYYRLFNEAERVRWQVADIPWDSIEKAKVSGRLIKVVYEIARSELTTFTATQRFLQEFSDDQDFTQWIAVWFYEETKHPQVLMRWLKCCGQSFETDFVLRGRETAPFMKERISTLVMNIISEMMASASYIGLAASTQEPVLKMIARNLAADEARHASSFYSYAKKMISTSESPDVERLAALMPLYYWLKQNSEVAHPINQLYHRLADQADIATVIRATAFESEKVQNRICMAIGSLIGRPMKSNREIMDNVKALALLARSQRRARR